MAKETDQFLRKTLFENRRHVRGPAAGRPHLRERAARRVLRRPGPAPTTPTTGSRVKLNPASASGLLTQASLLATMAKEDRTDPVRRGKFILEPDPVPHVTAAVAGDRGDVQAAGPEQDGARTVHQHRANAVCASCHSSLDPLGLAVRALRRRRAVARQRSRHGVDATCSGEHDGRDPFDGVPEMARLLADMPDARACYVAEWLRFSEGKLNCGPRQAVHRLADDAVHAQHARRRPGGGDRRQRHVPLPRDRRTVAP